MIGLTLPVDLHRIARGELLPGHGIDARIGEPGPTLKVAGTQRSSSDSSDSRRFLPGTWCPAVRLDRKLFSKRFQNIVCPLVERAETSTRGNQIGRVWVEPIHPDYVHLRFFNRRPRRESTEIESFFSIEGNEQTG